MRIYERYFARQIYLTFVFILFAFSGLFFFFDLINELNSVGHGGYKFQYAVLRVALQTPSRSVVQLKTEIDRSMQQINAMPQVLERRNEPAKRVTYQAYGWANVNRSGDYNMLHSHPGCDWSVVYYVATGNPSDDNPMSGRIELRDPRPAAVFAKMPGFNSGQPMLIKPQAGMMLAFPAWIEHQVHPFAGEGNRISIAVNVTLDRN